MKRKILHIAGGLVLQKLYHNIFVQFAKKSYQQDIYVPCNTEDKMGKNQKDLPDTRYAYFTVDGMIDRLLLFPKTAKHFKEIKRVFHPIEFQHCFAYTVMTDGSLAYKLNQEYGTPYSVFVRNTDINIFYKYFVWLRPLFKAILKNAAYINFPNPSYRDRLYKMLSPTLLNTLQEKTRIIPNGIDDFWHQHSLEVPKRKSEGQPFRLLFVGKLEKNKNVHNIVAAVNQLNLTNDFHLTLIGTVDDGIKDEVERWKAELGMRLSVKGPIFDQNTLLAEYRSADLFVMPSFTETFGLVYIEALTQGLPIIYTKGEGVSGFFDDVGNGLEIENPRNIDELAKKILLIAENYDNYVSRTVESAKSFQWEKIILSYLIQIRNHEKSNHN